jgi:hypothetical protein
MHRAVPNFRSFGIRVKLKKEDQKLTLGAKVGLPCKAAILRGDLKRPPVATSSHSGGFAGAGLAGAAGAAGAGSAPIRPTSIVVIDSRPPPRRMLEPYITSVPGAQPTRSSSVMHTQVLVIARCPSGWVHGFSPESSSDCTLKRPILVSAPSWRAPSSLRWRILERSVAAGI